MGPGRVLEASTRGVFDRVPPRGSQRAIWDHFGSILEGFWEHCWSFWHDFLSILNGFGENFQRNRTERERERTRVRVRVRVRARARARVRLS